MSKKKNLIKKIALFSNYGDSITADEAQDKKIKKYLKKYGNMDNLEKKVKKYVKKHNLT